MGLREIEGIQKPVVAHARATGWLAWKMKIEGRNGCPDFWFFKDGSLLIVEFKAPGRQPSVQQRLRANDLLTHGFQVFVIDNAQAGISLLDQRS